MASRTTAFTPSEPDSTLLQYCLPAIVRDPLVVSPDKTVMEAIAQMSGMRSQDEGTHNHQLDDLQLGARSSCVLVVEDSRVVGILTERDVVRLSAEHCPLDQCLVREVMTQQMITLHETDFTDLLHVVNLLQQNHIRHLPILDAQNRLAGLVTHESLRQIFQPLDLLRLRLVEEMMTRTVVCAAPDASMAAIAQLMANHHVSCVVLVEMDNQATASLTIPVGMLTERDVVQLQVLGLSLETYTAQSVMRQPVLATQAQESLWTAHQIMEHHHVRRLVVTGEKGQLLGIVTQTNLLQAFNPLELYKLTEALETKIARLEAEKITLLENRAAELKREVEARTAELQAQAEREKLLSDLATQIRSSLSLETILDTTVKQVRNLLDCDRVNVWRFEANWCSVVVAESTKSSLSLMGERIVDTCLQDYVDIYTQGQVRVVPDIYTTEMSDCHREMLIHLQTRAKILVPLLCGDELWGLLNVTESGQAREWQPEEVSLLQALSVQLAIALQQATAYQTAQAELEERKKAEAALQLSENRFRAIFDNMFQFVGLLSPEGILVEANETALIAAGITREDVVGRPFWEAYWWQISPVAQAQLRQAITRAAQDKLVRYEADVWGINKTLIPIEFSLRPLKNEAGQVISLIAEGRDLTEAKRLEAERSRAFTYLRASEQRYVSLAAAVPVGIFRADAAGRCTYVNDRYCQITGLMPEQVMGQRWQQGLHPEDRDWVSHAWEAFVQDNSPFQLEYRFQRPDGVDMWVYGQAVAERGMDEQIIGYVGTVTDISDRKQAEAERLQAAQVRLELKLLEQILDIVLAGYWDWDIPNHQEYLSPGFKRMFGYEDHELPNTPESWQKLIFPEDLPQVLDCFERHVQSRGEIPYYNEVRYRHKNGSIIWVMCSGQVIEWDVSGNPLRMIGCHIDISDRKQVETELQTSRAYYQGIIADQTELICRFSPDGTLTFVNDAYCQFFQESSADLIGQSFTPLIPEADEDIPVQTFNSLSVENPVATCEHRVIAPDGNIRWQQWTNRALFDSEGNFIEFQAVGRDITALKETEAALRESEARWQFALEGSGDGVWDWHPQTNTIFFSRQLQTMLGYAAGELSHRLTEWESRVHPEDKDQCYADLNRHIRGEAPIYQSEHRMRCKDGSYRWMLDRGKVIEWTADGAPLRIIGTFSDISDRKRAEQKLATSEARFRTLIDSLPFSVWVRDANDRLVLQNPADMTRFGDRLGSGLEELDVPPEVIDLYWQIKQRRHLREVITQETTELIAGEEHYFLRIETALPDINGDYGVLGVAIDITPQKRAEKAFKISEERLRTLIDALPFSIWVRDASDRLIFQNLEDIAQHGNLIGTRLEEDPISQQWIERHAEVKRRCQTEKSIRCEIKEHIHDKERAFLRINGTLPDLDGSTGIFGVSIDITERKHTEEKIRQYSTQLEASNRELEAFAYSVSHDLRAPLRAIDGFSRALLEDYGDMFNEEAQDYFNRIRRNVARMGELIDDLLSLSRVSRAEICYATVNLS
ncbi:MAG: PAS domain S-box protein, partial [Cyanobacteria bacterium J06559_3]